jgi:hypothetical protein
MLVFATVYLVAALAQDALIPPDAEQQKQAILKLDDAGVDAQFQCPDTLPNPERDEMWKIGLFLYWAKNKHPDWTYARTVEFRHELFIRHQCAPWPPHS